MTALRVRRVLQAHGGHRANRDSGAKKEIQARRDRPVRKAKRGMLVILVHKAQKGIPETPARVERRARKVRRARPEKTGHRVFLVL